MRSPCLVLFLACCAAWSAARAEEPKGEPPPLYPLKKGFKWTWGCVEAATNHDNWESMTQEVLDVEPYDGKLCYVMEVKMAYPKNSTIMLPRKELLAFTRDGLYVAASRGFSFSTNREETSAIGRKVLATGSDPLFQWKDGELDVKQYQDNVKLRGGSAEVAATVVAVTEKTADPKVFFPIRPEGTESIVTKTWYVRGLGPVRKEIAYQRAKEPLKSVYEVTEFTGTPATVGRVVVNPDASERQGRVDEVEAPRGVVTEFKKTRTISREVSWQVKATAGVELGAKLEAGLAAVRGEVSAKVKASVEAQVGEKLKDTETYEQVVRINGDVLPRAKIIWVDTYRTGTVTVTHEGKTHTVPFEFPVGTRLIVREK